jgi:hypothetical protein
MRLTTQTNLAVVLQEQGKPAQAEPLLREVLQRRRKVLPAGHPDMTSTLLLLGSVLLDTRYPGEAEPLLREGLRAIRQALPGEHWQVGDTESLLGGCLVAQARYAEAEPLLRSGYEILKTSRGAPPQQTRQALDRLVRLYESWKRPGEAARMPADSRARSRE